MVRHDPRVCTAVYLPYRCTVRKGVGKRSSGQENIASVCKGKAQRQKGGCARLPCLPREQAPGGRSAKHSDTEI